MQLFLVDKDVLVREGLTKLLESEGHEICGVASSVPEAISHRAAHRADILTLTPSQTQREEEAVVQIREAFPEKPVLIVAARVDKAVVRNCLLAGADGFLVRWAQPQELHQALGMLRNGQSYLHPEVVGYVVSGLRQNELCTLTGIPPRELQVLRFVAAGTNNTEIAAKLYISRSTVKNLLRSLFDRFEVGDRTRLVAEAMRVGVLRE